MHFSKNRLFFFIIVVVYITFVFFFKTDMKVSINVGAFNTIGAIASFIGIILFIEIVKLFPYSKLGEYIGRRTLILYMFSGAIPNVVSVICLKIISSNAQSYMFVSILSFLLALPIVWAIDNYLPFFTDLRKLKKYGI